MGSVELSQPPDVCFARSLVSRGSRSLLGEEVEDSDATFLLLLSLCGEQMRGSFHSCLCSTLVPSWSPGPGVCRTHRVALASGSVPRKAGRQALAPLPREVIRHFCT